MKQYTLSCEVYSIDELSEKAQSYAYSKWLNSDHCFYEGYTEEIRNTLDEFCRLFDVRCTSWSFDEYSYDFCFDIQNEQLDESEMSGIRLAKYIWNNYAKYIRKGKCYSLWSKLEKSEKNPDMGKLKIRNSKVFIHMDDCPLTGYYFDCVVLSKIIDCLTYKKLYHNYQELICACLNDLFSAAQEDCNYQSSEEYFKEEAKNNNYEYCEDGSVFSIPMCAKIA